ncbi:MAG TPA: hypothetical protein VHE30_20510 [Polyangiaceae bacterium]|nr:hypothetical protein [Polyangiaceae bacterium]
MSHSEGQGRLTACGFAAVLGLSIACSNSGQSERKAPSNARDGGASDGSAAQIGDARVHEFGVDARSQGRDPNGTPLDASNEAQPSSTDGSSSFDARVRVDAGDASSPLEGGSATGCPVCASTPVADCKDTHTTCTADSECSAPAGGGARCAGGECWNWCAPGAVLCPNVALSSLYAPGPTCVDVKTDNEHCGACNAPCDGDCVDGTCKASGTDVVSALPAGYALALQDATHLYLVAGKSLVRVPKGGGTLGDVTTTSVGFANPRIENGYIYWTDTDPNTPTAGDLMRVAVDGTGRQLVASNFLLMAVHDGYAYTSGPFDVFSRVALTGGSVASSPRPEHNLTLPNLVDPDGVYAWNSVSWVPSPLLWADGCDCTKPPYCFQCGPPNPLGPSLASSVYNDDPESDCYDNLFASNSNHVYCRHYFPGGEVGKLQIDDFGKGFLGGRTPYVWYQSPFASDLITPVSLRDLAIIPGAMAADDRSLFLYEGFLYGGYVLLRVDLCSKTVTRIRATRASGPETENPDPIFVDDAFVYWRDASAVHRLPKGP